MKNIYLLLLCLFLPINTYCKEIQSAAIGGIEYFIQKPAGNGPFPVIFLLHGYQPPDNSNGGKQLVDFGYLDHFVKEGIAAISISIPGYGNSCGLRDFGGLESQLAIISVINHFKHQPEIDPLRMGIYGISRGAHLAALVALREENINLQILEVGFYDVISFCSNEIPTYLNGIKDSIFQEVGSSHTAFIERSLTHQAQLMKADTLILEGEFNDRRQLHAAKSLHTKLLQNGTNSSLTIFPNESHTLPVEKWDVIIPFLRKILFELHGIGIKVSPGIPAIQIRQIYTQSPAERSGRLKIGDAVLAVSPNNNHHEVSTLKMSEREFVSLILGEKGSSLRLRVQHFDLSIEDIVIER